MASAAELAIAIVGKDQATPVLAKVGESLSGLEKRSGLLKTAIGGLAGLATGKLVGALGSAAKAAADDEANMLKLQKAVENSGASWEENVDRIGERIKAGQGLAFTDDQIRDSLSILTAQTDDLDEALRRQKMAMDLSRGAGIDLQTASKLLGKVTDENVNVLARYGVNVEKGADATALFGAVQKKFGGQAETYGKTTAASIFKTKDAIDEWKESIGASMGPLQGFLAVGADMAPLMNTAGLAIGGLAPHLGGLKAMLMTSVIPAIVSTVVAMGPILLVIAAVGLAVLALKWAWENNFLDIQGKTQAVIRFLQDLFDGFKLLVLNVFKGIVLGVTGAINGVIGVINGFIEAYNSLAEKLGLPLLGKVELITPNLAAIDAAIDQAARDRAARITVTTSYIVEGGHAITAAHGFEGTVRRPTLFMAGEAGEEHVSITPRGGGRGGGTSVVVNLNVGSLIGLDGPDVARRLAQVVGDEFTGQRRLAGLA